MTAKQRRALGEPTQRVIRAETRANAAERAAAQGLGKAERRRRCLDGPLAPKKKLAARQAGKMQACGADRWGMGIALIAVAFGSRDERGRPLAV